MGLSGTEKTKKVLTGAWAKETMATSVPGLGRLQRDKEWDLLHQWQSLQHSKTMAWAWSKIWVVFFSFCRERGKQGRS